jgi:pilin isopeptide linkage protein
MKQKQSFVALFAMMISFVMCAFLLPAGQAHAADSGASSADVASVLTITQTFTQPAGVGDPGTFEYTLTAVSGTDGFGNLPSGARGNTYTFSMSGDGATAKPFDSIVFTHPGIFQYNLSQISGDQKGMTYDNTQYEITVVVTDQPDGSYAINSAVVQVPGRQKQSAITFRDLYALSGVGPSGKMADPPVNKTVQGSPSSSQKWEFDLTAQNSSNPMPEGSANGVKKVYITGSGSTDFGEWGYTAPGTYIYKITEKDTGATGYTYDKSVYTITDYVTVGEGALKLDRVVTNDANKNVASFDFVNTFTPPVPAPTPPPQGCVGAICHIPSPQTGTDVMPFVVTTIIAVLGAGFCFFFLIAWKRKKDDEDEEQVSVATAN